MSLTQKTAKIIVKDNSSNLYELNFGAESSSKEIGILNTEPTAANTANLDNNSLIFEEISSPATTIQPVYTSGQQTIDGVKKFTAGIFSGIVNLGSDTEIDVTAGNVFIRTIVAPTTFTIANTPSNMACEFLFVITNGGSNTITWPSTIIWLNGSEPTLKTSGTDILRFITYNGGTTWYAELIGASITSIATQSANGLMSSTDKTKLDNIDLSLYTPTANLATVATSGSYNDLDDKPVIITDLATTSTDGLMSAADKAKINKYGDGRVRHLDKIKAIEALTGGNIIVGTASGYRKVAPNVIFDITYPLIITLESVAANQYVLEPYLTMNDKRISSMGNVPSFTAVIDKMVYLVGTLSGVMFTIDTNVITQTVPNTEDGKVYLPLGIADSATAFSFVSSRQLYAYRNGTFDIYTGSSNSNSQDEDVLTLTGSSIDLSLGKVFKKTISANTTFTISGAATNKFTIFTLLIEDGGNFTVTWPNTVNWSDGIVPTLTTDGIDILTFATFDGTTWYGGVFVSGV